MQRRCSCTKAGGRSAMHRWIDELSFHQRVVLTTLVAAITVGSIVWDVI